MSLIEGSPVHPPREPMRIDAACMNAKDALKQAAELLYQYCGSSCPAAVLTAGMFAELMGFQRPWPIGVETMFPIQAGIALPFKRGSIIVTTDVRLTGGSGWLRDPLTGDSVQIKFGRPG